jgi:glycosyltransferase involved in cell wall biosynthesis
MLEGHPVYVVVPARDEAPRIPRVIRRMPAFVDRVIVVDDGSVDGTREVAEAELAARGERDDRAAEGPRGVVLRHEAPRGVGAAIARGYAEARAELGARHAAIAVMAGDDQMHPDDLEAVVTPVLRGEAGYVKGNRFAWPDRARPMPLGRKLGGVVFAAGTSLACGQRLHDSQCGYTAIARGALERLDLQRFWPGYGYPNVVLAELARAGVRIHEVPVRAVYADEVSRLRLRHVVTIGRLVAREAWKTHAPALLRRPLLPGRAPAE